LQKADSQILVILEADILLRDRLFLEKLIAPILFQEADLTSCPIEGLPPRNFLENVLQVSMTMKNQVFEKFRRGDNIYTCHGPARAFSKNLYKKITFPQSVGQDAYSYIYSQTHGFKYVYADKAEVWYRLPGNFTDHFRQSRRFFDSQRLLKKQFGEKFVSPFYHLPVRYVLETTLFYLVRKPVETLTYIFLLVFSRAASFSNRRGNNDVWTISYSSKNLHS
jgi:hypothetical protein